MADYDLATFQDAKSLYGYEDGDEQRISQIISFASARMELYCNRRLAARDYIWRLSGTGGSSLILPEFPVNSLLPYRAVGDLPPYIDMVIDDSENRVFLDSNSGSLKFLSGDIFPAGVANIIVSANAGYTIGDHRRELLKGACLEYVNWIAGRWSAAGSIGKKGEYSADGISVSYETDIPLHVKSILQSFVRGNLC